MWETPVQENGTKTREGWEKSQVLLLVRKEGMKEERKERKEKEREEGRT